MKAVGLKKAEAQKQNWQMKEDSLKIDKKKTLQQKQTEEQSDKTTDTNFFTKPSALM